MKKIFYSAVFAFVLLLSGLLSNNVKAQGTFDCFQIVNGPCGVNNITCDTAAGYNPDTALCVSFTGNPTECNAHKGNTCISTSSIGTAGCQWDNTAGKCIGSFTNTCGANYVPNDSYCSNFPDNGSCTAAAQAACITDPVLAIPPTQQTQPGTWFDRDFLEWYPLVYDTEKGSPETEIFGERYTAAQVEWIIYAWWAFNLHRVMPKEYATCILSNWGNPITTNACLLVEWGKKLLNPGAQIDTNIDLAASQNKSLISKIFETRPISGIGYVKQKFNLVTDVHAQGFGFTQMGFVQDLWQISRNLAFSLTTIIIVILAFMIMFRMKTSPQTAITVQSAIPKIFITIVLIAFSFAIAGFLIDMVYVVIGVVATMLSRISTTKDATDMYNFMIGGPNNKGLMGIFSDYMEVFPIALFLAVEAAVTGVLASVGTFVGSFFIVLIFFFLGWIAALWLWIRTIWAMLKVMLSVVVSIILAPFQILIGAVVPGMGFGPWLRSMTSNLLVFAAIGPMMAFALLFLYLSFGNHHTFQQALKLWSSFRAMGIDFGSGRDFWTPPLLSGGDYLPLIYLFMSLGIISSVPKVAEAIQGFMSGRPISAGSAIGEALGPVTGLSTMGASYLSGRQQARYSTLANPNPRDTFINTVYNTADSLLGGKLRRK